MAALDSLYGRTGPLCQRIRAAELMFHHLLRTKSHKSIATDGELERMAAISIIDSCKAPLTLYFCNHCEV